MRRGNLTKIILSHFQIQQVSGCSIGKERGRKRRETNCYFEWRIIKEKKKKKSKAQAQGHFVCRCALRKASFGFFWRDSNRCGFASSRERVPRDISTIRALRRMVCLSTRCLLKIQRRKRCLYGCVLGFWWGGWEFWLSGAGGGEEVGWKCCLGGRGGGWVCLMVLPSSCLVFISWGWDIKMYGNYIWVLADSFVQSCSGAFSWCLSFSHRGIIDIACLEHYHEIMPKPGLGAPPAVIPSTSWDGPYRENNRPKAGQFLCNEASWPTARSCKGLAKDWRYTFAR